MFQQLSFDVVRQVETQRGAAAAGGGGGGAAGDKKQEPVVWVWMCGVW